MIDRNPLRDKPVLFASYFGDVTTPRGGMYQRLAMVLESSAKRHLPGWEVRVERITEVPLQPASGNPSHGWNTLKLEWWRDMVRGAPDGARLLLIDGDTAILKPLDSVWRLSFDIAYTVRERGLPLNGGVIFLRVSKKTRAFMETWWEINSKFFHSDLKHAPWRAKYAGINQAALGCLLETVAHGCALERLPCREWNCCQWQWLDCSTRIIHVKSVLRRAVFGVEAPRTGMQPMINLWRGLEGQTDNALVKALWGPNPYGKTY